jgi:hypothetical protein
MAFEDATVKAVTDAMKPMLDLMKSEIVASQQAAIIQLQESFLQQILQLNETIGEYTTRVVALEESCRIAKGDEGNQNGPETHLHNCNRSMICPTNPQPRILPVTPKNGQ